MLGPAAAASAGISASYAAFYSDCRHEVRKLRSGYRVCLVYNLSIRPALARKCGAAKQLSAATQTDAVQQLTEVLGQWNRDTDCERPNWIALPLEHLEDRSRKVLELPLASERRRHLHCQIESKQLDVTHDTRDPDGPMCWSAKKPTAPTTANSRPIRGI